MDYLSYDTCQCLADKGLTQGGWPRYNDRQLLVWEHTPLQVHADVCTATDLMTALMFLSQRAGVHINMHVWGDTVEYQAEAISDAEETGEHECLALIEAEDPDEFIRLVCDEADRLGLWRTRDG